MPCYSPWVGYYAKDVNPSGKRSIVANPRLALEPDGGMPMPCGRCVGCRLKYARNWAIRLNHEASLHRENQFLTLTFAPEFLPPHGSLRIADCQSFMKRYREWLWRSERKKIRMAYCGEYGSKGGRPHYHFIIFGHMFADRKYRTRRNGHVVWSSERLEKLWPFGRSEIGSVTFQSASYVARYILEKKHGPMATEYWVIDPATGELLNENTKEFFKVSRRPGIGQGWFDKFCKDMYSRDEVVMEGRKFPPPKFYDGKYELLEPDHMSDIRAERAMKLLRRDKSDDNYDRLKVREKVQLAALANLPRSVE